MQKENRVLEYIQTNMHTERMDRLMPAVTHMADGGIAWFLLCALFMMRETTRILSLSILISLGIEAVVCNLMVKPLAKRKRPCDLNPDVPLLIRRPTDPSFPSGHTGASFAAVTAMFLYRNIFWLPSGLLACAIAYSRMYLYVHYPTDILGGILVGIFSGFIGSKIVTYMMKKRANQNE